MTAFFLTITLGRPPHPVVRRAVDEGAGRCFPFVQVAQKLLAKFVQHCLLTSSRIYVIIIIERERNSDKKNKKIFKKPLTNS